MDNSEVAAAFKWRIEIPLPVILEQIAQHAREHPEWS
jgi:hypothetical protein